ncbi:MAG: class I SAM-dependent methyltransferase [Deltaproteobacteria bacterium]|jgi:cyclopropane-fatty-acyl-phospholipid synthase|nr:class I SAM-dependent methyltransferase [Deltaproteobacteria bacterium]
MLGIRLAESGLLPDALIRIGIRNLLRKRLQTLSRPDCESTAEAEHGLREALRAGPIALHADQANEQHYEIPAAFYERVLGRRLKYSCGLWDEQVSSLDESEEGMLDLTARRAGIEDGMRILDLGCGWGSFSLWVAEHYPSCRILAVSNSKSQREFILARCRSEGFENIEVVTSDVNHFRPDRLFDRVVSVEMFEHVRNHERLLANIASWLDPAGKLFVHHFAHRDQTYLFEDAGSDDWMAREFFTGGMMPSNNLLLHHQRDLLAERQWVVSGKHYQKTCEAWLQEQDAARNDLLPILAEAHGREDAKIAFQRWRLFFMACAELFGFRDGNEWWVSHVLMAPRGFSR